MCLDPTRTWCPSPGCHTICYISHGSKYQGVAVTCPTCTNTFCSSCSASWHMGLSCKEAEMGNVMESTFPWEGFEENIKKCPQCQVMIEKNEGCAQMMCRSCKHVFCWFCLAGLDVSYNSSYEICAMKSFLYRVILCCGTMTPAHVVESWDTQDLPLLYTGLR